MRNSERSVDEGKQLEMLNEQAERCRRLAGATYDREIAAMLGRMAEGYERTAEELSKKRPI